ncbi:hypothetical protein BGZ47_010965 [Haplosporangium gracile]|nr:hypothetical protein BGZ47_010965 [Haplosporangium gracile]
MTNNRLTLFCLVDGEGTSNAFSVEIESTKTIGDFKRLIKIDEIPILFNNIAKKEKDKLRPPDDLSDVFDGKAHKKTIHIIVQRPSQAITVQVVAEALEPGRYLITDTNRQKAFATGPLPRVFPPLDVPLRLVSTSSLYVNRWDVKRTPRDLYTITAVSERGLPADYKIVSIENKVFASVTKAPQEWSITQAGDGQYVIQDPVQDRVFTSNAEEYPGVILEPADGGFEQRWRFERLED